MAKLRQGKEEKWDTRKQVKNIIKQGRFRKKRHAEELRRKRKRMLKIRGINKLGIRKKRKIEKKKT